MRLHTRPSWTFDVQRFDVPEELRDKKVADLRGDASPEELRGKTPEELHRFVAVLDAHLKDLHQSEDGELRDQTVEEKEAFDYGLQLRQKAMDMIDHHNKVQEIFRRKSPAVERAVAFMSSDSTLGGEDIRRLTPTEARDRALRNLDDRRSTSHLRSDEKDQVEKMLRSDANVARRILVTETDDYRSAFLKATTRPNPILTPEEQRALLQWEEFRAASEGTSSAGGYGIPVYIDPSIIMTSQGSSNPFLSIARQVQVNTNAWKGVSSAGVTWSFDSEAAQVSDDTPTLAQPSVTVFMARGFIPFSIEVADDYPAFASEMQRLLAEGYDELLVDKLTRGNGSTEPKGILTALSANTNVRVTVTTVGTIGAPDPYKVWQQVPQRFRRNASWLMSVSANNAVRQIGSTNVYHGYTVNLPSGWADQLFNSPVYESAYMPATTTSNTAPEGVAVVGDFSNFVIARNGGMNVELAPLLFQQTTAGTGFGLPTGQRGWFAHTRIGSNSVNDLGFRLLVNS